MRIAGSFCLLALLYGTALADDARQLRIEAGVLIQKAEASGNAQERQTFLETAYGKLLEIQQRFPDQSTSLTLYLAGKRVNLSPSDVAAMVAVAPLLADLDVGRLQEVLGRHPSPTAVDENGWTDLHWAAALNQPELARALIDSGADVGAELHDDGEPLSDRLKQSMSEVGLDLNFSRRGYHPSHIAAFADATETLTALFAAGAAVNTKAANNGWTPLFAAASGNAGKVAAILIKRGADINVKGNYGWTPLHVAALENAGEVAAILIEHGADINAENTNFGWTPLHAAALGNAGEIAAILIEYGADINAKDNDGESPLEVATTEGAHAVVATLRKQLGDR